MLKKSLILAMTTTERTLGRPEGFEPPTYGFVVRQSLHQPLLFKAPRRAANEMLMFPGESCQTPPSSDPTGGIAGAVILHHRMPASIISYTNSRWEVENAGVELVALYCYQTSIYSASVAYTL